MSIRRELDYLDLSQNKLASVEGLDSLENVAFVSLGELVGFRVHYGGTRG
jgi:hypothetical protein